MPDNGYEWRKFRVALRLHPCVPLFSALFNRGGNRRACRLPGEEGILSIVRGNLRPVIFGVDTLPFSKSRSTNENPGKGPQTPKKVHPLFLRNVHSRVPLATKRLPTYLYSKRISLGNFVCFVSTKDKF